MSIYSITAEECEALNRSLSEILGVEYSTHDTPVTLFIVDDGIMEPWNKGRTLTQEHRDAIKGYNFTPQQYEKVINHLNKLRETMYTEERNLKISKALTGRKHTQERKDNISKSKLGTIMSGEQKKKISESMKGKGNFGGRKHSPETRAKMSAAIRPPPWNKGKKKLSA